jgi:glycosyltransferase involved in cell wall biosynthesis
MHLEEGIHKDFKARTKAIRKVLEEHLNGVDVCIAHDIVAQATNKEHNAAVREYAKTRPDLLWLHWLHSRPVEGKTRRYPENLRHIAPPGYIVYPNSSDLAQVQRSYNLQGEEWRAIANRSGHAIDQLAIWPYDRLTKDLTRGADLMNGEVVAVYPARLDRGKQVEKAIRLIAGVKNAGYEPRFLVLAWQSSGKRFQKYIDELLDLAEELGVKDCVYFSNRMDDRCSQGIPRQIVLELMDLCNVYIHPSNSETYSLVIHEAFLRGLMCCLNGDLPQMRELFGDQALYFDFESSSNERRYQPDEQTFWNDEARRLIAHLKHNRGTWGKTIARREWSPQAQWKEFEPLLYLPSVAGHDY